MVNMTVSAMKVYNFFYFASISILMVHIPHFCQTMGVKSPEIGILAFTSCLMSFLSRLIFGAIADRFHCSKLILFVTPILTGLLFILMLLIPKNEGYSATLTLHVFQNDTAIVEMCTLVPTQEPCWPQKMVSCTSSYFLSNLPRVLPSYTKIGGGKDSQSKICELYNSTMSTYDVGTLSYHCQNVVYTNANTTTCEFELNSPVTFPFKSINVAWSTSFILILVVRSLGYFFQCPASCILDALSFQVTLDKPITYTSIKRFGTIGFLTFAIISAIVEFVAPKGIRPGPDYSTSAAFFMIVCIAMAASVVFMKIPDAKTALKQQLNLQVFRFNECRYLGFYTICFLAGSICISIFEDNIFIVADNLFSVELYFLRIMTVAMAMSDFFTSIVIDQLHANLGVPLCISVSLVAWGIRFILYSVVYYKWFYVFIEILHGFSHNFLVYSISTYSDIIAPPGYEATFQGFSQALCFGLGNGLGSLIGGFIATLMSDRLYMRINGCLAIGCAILYGIFVLLWHKKETNNDEEAQIDASMLPLLEMKSDVNNEFPQSPTISEYRNPELSSAGIRNDSVVYMDETKESNRLVLEVFSNVNNEFSQPPTVSEDNNFELSASIQNDVMHKDETNETDPLVSEGVSGVNNEFPQPTTVSEDNNSELSADIQNDTIVHEDEANELDSLVLEVVMYSDKIEKTAPLAQFDSEDFSDTEITDNDNVCDDTLIAEERIQSPSTPIQETSGEIPSTENGVSEVSVPVVRVVIVSTAEKGTQCPSTPIMGTLDEIPSMENIVPEVSVPDECVLIVPDEPLQFVREVIISKIVEPPVEMKDAEDKQDDRQAQNEKSPPDVKKPFKQTDL